MGEKRERRAFDPEQRRDKKPADAEGRRERKPADSEQRPAFLRENQLEGKNAVLEVLKSDRDIEKIWIVKESSEPTLRRIAALARERGVVVQETGRAKLDAMSQTKNHQGVMAFVSSHAYAQVEDLLALARERNEPPLLVMLDQVTDPHNLGAVIRTAECAGAHGVIIPKHRAVGLTPIVGKTSAGALEHLPVAKVTNLKATIADLKKEGLWVACADMDGQPCYQADLKGPLLLVVGSEGEGVSRLVKEACDFTVSIPMYGKISSLNASVAASLLLYEAVRQRRF